MEKKEKHAQKLLVEGNDDLHVVWNLCEYFSLVENFEIVDCKNDDQILKAIPVRLKAPDMQTLGIIIDADVDLDKRWNQIISVFAKSGYKLPNELPEGGLISEDNPIKIGIWIMPNNNTTGMLEDFIKFLVPSDDKLMSITTEVLDRIESENLNRYSFAHRQKAEVHTWLAWQERPGTPMGQAIKQKALNPEAEISKLFIEWLSKLFN